MMPWRDQLRLGWKILRWLYWPPPFPVWANVAMWITIAAALVAVTIGSLWGFAVCVIVVCVIGWVVGGPK